ncbi:S-layer homology domain-containing protein [Thermoanaerobacterium sp. DL9XJH110]|uniref:S-layer homology domain-containing protein n=1 Tax=Thermoanaerobacterium sp. DL9XJH110 TaxID=3386643 RepID=UPI003BB6CEC8
MKKIKRKKWMAVLLLAMLLVTFAMPAGFAKGPEGKQPKGKSVWKGFNDVDNLEWARLAIDRMYAMGVFTGYPGGYFKPKNNVTHLEAIIIALRVMGWEDEAKSLKSIPKDVKNIKLPWADAYYYVAMAVEKGIVKPEELKSFNPNAPAKRYEVARYIVRAAGREDEAEAHMKEKLPFKDAAAIPKNAVGYVYVAVDLGLMKGYPGNLFMPQRPVTRAEMAVIINKLNDVSDEGDGKKADGVITDIDIDEDGRYSITVKTGGDEKTYYAAENAPVYIDEKYRGLNDLQVGDRVELVLDVEGMVIFIQVLGEREEVTFSADGLVYDVDEKDDEISIVTYAEEEDEGFVGVLKKSDIEGSHYELDTGDERFVLVGQTGGMQYYVGEKIVVIGGISADRVSIYMSGGLIEVKKFYPVRDRDVLTFKIGEDTDITVDGKPADLSDIEAGDRARVKAEKGDGENVAISVEVHSFKERLREITRSEIRNGRLRGRVYSFALRDQRWEITVVDEENVKHTFTLDSNVKLKGIDRISDIKAGMEVELTIDGSLVVEIEA